MPSGEIIVADSGPLIALGGIGQLALLRQLAERVVMPELVWNEATQAKPSAAAAREIAAQHWIEIVMVDQELVDRLAPLVIGGEAEAIVYAQTHSNCVLLLDDLRARRVAELFGLNRMGTLAVLALAKKTGLILEVRSHIAALRSNDIYLGDPLVEAILKEAGESE